MTKVRKWAKAGLVFSEEANFDNDDRTCSVIKCQSSNSKGVWRPVECDGLERYICARNVHVHDNIKGKGKG